MNASYILPEVFLNIICLLEADKSRNGWNLSRSPNGKLSISITHFSAKEHERSSVNQHRSLSVLVSQEQDTTASGHQIPHPKKKKKTPAQRRRARKRFQKWLDKRKANSGTVKVAESVSTEQTADPMVLDTVSCGSGVSQYHGTHTGDGCDAAGSSLQAAAARFTLGPIS